MTGNGIPLFHLSFVTISPNLKFNSLIHWYLVGMLFSKVDNSAVSYGMSMETMTENSFLHEFNKLYRYSKLPEYMNVIVFL